MGQQEETRSIAAHDSLTKIYNFTAFCESSRKYLLSAGAGRSMGVIYANIIDFKSVNELYGLPEGDRMLGAFADFLKHLPRTRVCGRIFSDNFLCLFERTPGVDLYDEALGFAGAVERFLVGQQPFHPRSKPQIVSGISALEGGGEGLSAAIDGANIAHKEAKKKYRTACAVFDEALKDEMARAIRLQADLQAALEREQFTFYLQPKVNLRTGRVAGAEALARWKKPDGTVAGPAEFVPLLERTGNVEQLDFMIYEQVCRYLCGRQAGDSIVVPVSVNVSRAHLKDTDFVQKVKQLLIRYGVHPSLMEFELTETMLAESMEEAAAVIRGLRALGCKVSIDDFGTGYSALNLLKELEFDILKLDGSFVSGAAAEGYKSDVILRNIIRMADELYMTVLCEGLETAGQVERLNTFGCTLAQGYYFAQPMPAEAFEAFVQQAGGYCALPWGGADGAQRLPDYCEASALTDSAVRSITHSLFDAVPCAVAGVDPSSRQLLFANEQLFSLCGYPRGQMAEMEKAFFAHIATEPEKARLYAEMRRQFGTAGRCDTKLPVRRADGSVIWVRMTATYAGSPEWGRYLLCFFYDITREQTGTAAKSREIKQLSEERDFYAGMLSSIPCAVAQFRAEADGRYHAIHTNLAGARILGYESLEDFWSQPDPNVLSCVHPDDRRGALGNLSRLRRPGDARSFECRLVRRDGSVCWVSGTLQMLSGPEGSVIQVVFLDFTNRHALQTRFVHHYKRLARVLGQVLFEYEYGTDMLTFAGASESGLELPERAPAFLAEVHAGRFSQPFASYAACIAQALEEDGDDVCGAERRFELPGGGIWVRVSLVAVRGSSGARESAVGCIMDVTPQHEDRARLLRLTQTDSLTGVLNKRTTEQRCRTLWENTPGEKPFALLLLDVDNFKQTNDRYGHPKGDAVLRCLGENLSGLFRRDDVVGRVGGDEFLMMMPGAGGEQAVGRARKIAQEMCRSVSVQCGVDVSGSIGVVLSKPGACAYEELLRRADSALYAAKAAGKGCYRVYGGA